MTQSREEWWLAVKKHRGTIDKVDASAPTVSLAPVLLTSVIDAEERREVATIAIPDAFVQTKQENEDGKAVTSLAYSRAALFFLVLAPTRGHVE
jgi:hypothetical protein